MIDFFDNKYINYIFKIRYFFVIRNVFFLNILWIFDDGLISFCIKCYYFNLILIVSYN